MVSRRRLQLSRQLPRLARWAAPSVVAAAVAGVIAGVVEGVGIGDLLGIAATAGFVVVALAPVLLGGALAVRAVYLAWQPRELAPAIVEPDGSAPRLAAWCAVLWLALLVLAWAIHEGTWLLARTTEFRPIGVSLVQPVIATVAALLLLAVSAPAARALAAVARRGDARWRRGGRPTLLRPRAILGTAAVVALATAYGLWRLAIKPRLGPLDTSVLHGPALALVLAAAAHVVWGRVPRRALVGGAAVVLALAAVGSAFTVRAARPSLALEIWGDRPIAGLAIDQLFDLDEIRAGISLAEFRPTDVPGAAHPDILLVTIDTVRADRTPPYGGPASMPVLHALGERGAVFTWAYAPSNVTRRSIPAIAIGLEPNRIRGRVVGWALRVDPRHVLLAERLAAGGYETAGFMCCAGFWGEEIRTGLQRGLQHLEIDADGPQLAEAAARWLAAREARPDRKPLFLWMHILEPHNWTKGVGTPRTDDERKRFYDKSLAASDAMLGELLRPLAGRAPEQAPIVIVTADHGEALGEHGHDYHSTDLYNSQMRVPLVVAGPGIQRRDIPETVSLVSLVPTILELAGFQPPRLDAPSLADVLRGTRESVPDTGTAFAAMIHDRSNPGGITSVVKGRWKLIDNEDGVVELYDVYVDPDERTNLAAQRPELVRELRALLDAKLEAAKRSPFD